jgi:histidinol-phosphatase
MAPNAIDLAAELQFALSLADAADALTLPRFAARNFTVDLKANQTEVTEVDRGTETLIMDLIRAQRPHHAWYGEEHGSGGDGEYTWVIDPIDGTSNFVRGVPVWATLIGLVHRDRGPVLGVVSAPAMATRWWGYEGSGAFCNGHAIHVSDVTSLYDSHLSITANNA